MGTGHEQGAEETLVTAHEWIGLRLSHHVLNHVLNTELRTLRLAISDVSKKQNNVSLFLVLCNLYFD